MSDQDQTDLGNPGSQDDQGSDGQSRDWVADLNLDDQTRESIRATTFGGAEDLAKGYLSLQSKLGTTVQVPGEGATEEERAEFYKKLGRPDGVDGYDFTIPTDLPPGVTTDEQFMTWFKSQAHDAGLTKAQAKTLFDGYNQLAISRAAAQQKAKDEQNAAGAAEVTKILQSSDEWGANYEVESNLTQRVVDWLGPDMRAWFNESGAGNDIRAIRGINKIAHAVGEDNLVTGDDEGGSGPKTETTGILEYPSMKGMKAKNY